MLRIWSLVKFGFWGGLSKIWRHADFSSTQAIVLPTLTHFNRNLAVVYESRSVLSPRVLIPPIPGTFSSSTIIQDRSALITASALRRAALAAISVFLVCFLMSLSVLIAI